MTALVVGLGSRDRGDDGVGPAVAAAVAALGVPGLRVVVHEDPTCLVEVWGDAETVVVVDAVRSGAPPGTVHVLDATAGTLADRAWARTGRGGTHAFGLAAAVELARALRRLPPRLVLVGVEASSFGHGEPLGPEVADAVAHAVRTVTDLLAPVAAGEAGHVPR
ncbi:hydrogenase maturation protease [Actinotalea sp. Marseille-Q4924]|uniref:hydrogenase maturation protease n=1 Tax=Actinotalea sp. Marseille-Q4924 TaxID=2866571 RepID=UPI001CE473C7|nr:hydrogenase maturation protease [Actinotalea sp. Marseille-Q4924]